MRLENYLIENLVDDLEKNQVKYLFENLEHDCSEIIGVYKKAKGFLYRGSKKSINIWNYIKPREDRRPKDTPLVYHDMMDEIFKKKYGWRARSEGVFVSGKKMAKDYGLPYLFFPLNGYKYLWSETIQDLYSSVEDFDLFSQDHWEQWQEEYGFKTGHGVWIGDDGSEYKTMYDITKKSDWIETKGGIDNGRDIFSVKFKDDVWMDFTWEPDMSYNDWATEHEEELFYQYLKDKLDLNPYEHTNLEQYVRKNQIEYNQREAMFKCKGYYLINLIYEDEIKEYFGIYL